MTMLLTYLLGTLLVSFLCSVLEATLMSTPISYITMREEEGYKPASLMKRFKTDSARQGSAGRRPCSSARSGSAWSAP